MDSTSFQYEPMCSLCAPSSTILHQIQVTKIRVNNLCCIHEEKLIYSCLEKFKGISNISINNVGRYIIIKHCIIKCCAPIESILEILNQYHLGANLQEINDGENTTKDSLLSLHKRQIYQFTFLLLITIIFFITITFEFSHQFPINKELFFMIGTGVGSIPILPSAFRSFLRLSPDISILMLIGIASALVIGQPFDANLAVILFNWTVFVENVVKTRVSEMANYNPISLPKTLTLSDGSSKTIEQLKISDIISIRAGEMVAVDGVVLRGDGAVNESALTGEPTPISKKSTDRVFSGTLLTNGYLEVVMDVEVKSSTVMKLHQVVSEMQAERGDFTQTIDKIAMYWTPTVLLSAVLVCAAGGLATAAWKIYVMKAVSILALACPCAIVLAAPVPAVCTILKAVRNGILIKGSSVIERVAAVDTIAFDKTGTLTKGLFAVTDKTLLRPPPRAPPSSLGNVETGSQPQNEQQQSAPSSPSSNPQGSPESGACIYDPMALAAALEAKTAHPMAQAIVSEYRGCVSELQRSLPLVHTVQILEGLGVTGVVETVDGAKHTVTVGNSRLLLGPSVSAVAMTDKDVMCHLLEQARERTATPISTQDNPFPIQSSTELPANGNEDTAAFSTDGLGCGGDLGGVKGKKGLSSVVVKDPIARAGVWWCVDCSEATVGAVDGAGAVCDNQAKKSSHRNYRPAAATVDPGVSGGRVSGGAVGGCGEGCCGDTSYPVTDRGCTLPPQPLCSRVEVNAIETFFAKNVGKTVLLVIIDGRVEVLLALSDSLREESVEALHRITECGQDLFLLTGDQDDVATQICKEVGIPAQHSYSRLLPLQKLQLVQSMQGLDTDSLPDTGDTSDTDSDTDPDTGADLSPQQLVYTDNPMMPRDIEEGVEPQLYPKTASGSMAEYRYLHPWASQAGPRRKRMVMVVGDGINDAAALAASTVGVAMGAGGAQMACAAADVVLLNDNLLRIPAMIGLCRQARRLMIINCVAAIGIKIIAVVLAIIGDLSFWHAVLVDVGCLLLVTVVGGQPLFTSIFQIQKK